VAQVYTDEIPGAMPQAELITPLALRW